MSMGSFALAFLLVTTGAVPNDVFPINQRNFQIPIRLVDVSRKAEMKELILFVSADQGMTWKESGKATPDQESFSFYAPSDGIYWFSVCVVDQNGNRQPPDVAKVPPSQKVLVDTIKPILRIISAERTGNDVAVSWEIQEEHPDLATLKLEYRTADAPAFQWYTATINQATSGQARFAINVPGTVTVRMQVQDQAQNMTTAEKEVTTATASLASNSGTVAPPQPPPIGTGTSAGLASTTSSPAWESGRSAQLTSASRSDSSASGEAGKTAFPASRYQELGTSGTGNIRRPIASSDTQNSLVSTSTTASKPAQASAPGLQLVNTTQVPLDYEITKLGPSGIGKVELWMSQDDGGTWKHFADHPKQDPPMVVDLPGEGVYGLSMVVVSKAGLGKRPPSSGDAPDIRIEVDKTPPSVTIIDKEPDPNHSDVLYILFKATDKNLDPNSITLQWAEKPGKDWQNIGIDLPNDGRYAWHLPAAIPERVYLRLTARDMAGNVGEVVTPEPVLVDLHEPEAKIKGVFGRLASQKR